MNPSATLLMNYMSEISEQAYSASWMHGLEYALWEAVQAGPKTYGRLSVGEAQIRRLKELSIECGGWIVFDDKDEETWIALGDWERMFESNKDHYQLD